MTSYLGTLFVLGLMATFPAAFIHDWVQDHRKRDPAWRFWPAIRRGARQALRIMGWVLVMIGFIAFPIAFVFWAAITLYQMEKEDFLRRMRK